ncbi:putative L-threonine 3-dehydrogenase [Halalkalicoccus paucihalophilus]|uniref:Putative L-threonine 3-dehydrogenase n=1 Tax=Halalkalicoccus paucihalophilus TaxID=1008153 RepID=A0A151AK48_9EURY|nr:zinc-binding dehydrogenase [Halalkalicoccus paucihalophilus]KYH27945.1 putative L-threonine 3-dehydrogenase [Halalkalicoccus paucihalophilus]
MTARAVSFHAPEEVRIEERLVPNPDPGEVLVETACSGISPGTELLLYRGDAPADLPADETIPSLAGGLDYPISYGYAAVGRVIETTENVEDGWLGKRVFAFHPHTSHFCIDPAELQCVPDDLSDAEATLLPNVEAAINVAMDAAPVVGERAVVLGQGILGLLTTAILADHPLAALYTVDRYRLRRERSRALGADESVPPDAETGLRDALSGPHREGADFAVELSGNPAALDAAIDATGYDGRVLVGSWYGNKRASLDLGGRFHRSRIGIESTQVSTIDPPLRGRWGKARRLALAWDRLNDLDTEALLTHRLPVEEAPEAYRLLAERPEEAIGAVLTYDP